MCGIICSEIFKACGAENLRRPERDGRTAKNEQALKAPEGEIMKIVVLGGFLGSGKTTVLMQFARYLVNTSRAENPVIILENEISEAGVDNQLLTKANFTVENIFSGCICCSSTAALELAVMEIEKTYNPEWLLIEATGMAYPDSVRESLQKMGYSNASILALADAKRWYRVVRAMESFVYSQLKDADVILLNKIDLVDADTLLDIREKVAAYNPSARLEAICAIQEQGGEFWGSIAGALCP